MTESNGAVRTFTQPYSAVPYMLREGRGKFSLSAGRYHSGESVRSPEFLQGTLFYGLTAGFTLYGGTQLARDYQAWALGLGRGFGEFGSLGGMSPRPSPVRRRASAIRAIRCALSIRKILSARALRSASPAIATRQAAITILPKPAPLKAPRASRQPASPGRAVGVAKPWWPGSLAVSARSQEYWHRQSRDETVHLGFYSA
nr:Outer membrane usher protein fimD precursor [Klebsiella pneumoniae]